MIFLWWLILLGTWVFFCQAIIVQYSKTSRQTIRCTCRGQPKNVWKHYKCFVSYNDLLCSFFIRSSPVEWKYSKLGKATLQYPYRKQVYMRNTQNFVFLCSAKNSIFQNVFESKAICWESKTEKKVSGEMLWLTNNWKDLSTKTF